MGSVLLITFEVFVLHIVPVHFHRFNCFQMRRQRYELILEHPNFQRRKMISRTDPVIPPRFELSSISNRQLRNFSITPYTTSTARHPPKASSKPPTNNSMPSATASSQQASPAPLHTNCQSFHLGSHPGSRHLENHHPGSHHLENLRLGSRHRGIHHRGTGGTASFSLRVLEYEAASPCRNVRCWRRGRPDGRRAISSGW